MNYRVVISILLNMLSSQVFAEGLYLQQINTATLTAKQLADSKKKLAQHKDIVVRTTLNIAPFHKRGRLNASLEYSMCTGCHLSPPHTKNERTRTFMNMHTKFIACETCHFRPEAEGLSYRWEDVREGQPLKAKSKLFRQTVHADEKRKTRVTELHDFYKISPFYQGQSVVLGKNTAFNQETRRIFAGNVMDDKIKRRALIHGPLKEEGPACAACHDEKNDLLTLSALGANAYQRKQIYNNIIAQFFARYKEKKSRIRIMSILQ